MDDENYVDTDEKIIEIFGVSDINEMKGKTFFALSTSAEDIFLFDDNSLFVYDSVIKEVNDRSFLVSLKNERSNKQIKIDKKVFLNEFSFYWFLEKDQAELACRLANMSEQRGGTRWNYEN